MKSLIFFILITTSIIISGCSGSDFSLYEDKEPIDYSVETVSCDSELLEQISISGDQSDDLKILVFKTDEEEDQRLGVKNLSSCFSISDGKTSEENLMNKINGKAYHAEGMNLYVKANNCNSFFNENCKITLKLLDGQNFIIGPFKGLYETEVLVSEQYPEDIKQIKVFSDGLSIVALGEVDNLFEKRFKDRYFITTEEAISEVELSQMYYESE